MLDVTKAIRGGGRLAKEGGERHRLCWRAQNNIHGQAMAECLTCGPLLAIHSSIVNEHVETAEYSVHLCGGGVHGCVVTVNQVM
jgi:hypothetical protein